jgi:hypothetical protein
MEEEIILATTEDSKVVNHYGIVHTYNGLDWYGTSILSTDKADALKQFRHWTDIKDYKIFIVPLPIKELDDNKDN